MTNVAFLDPRKYGQPPEPTKKDPFAQVKWIFAKRRDRCTAKESKGNYTNGCMHYLRYLETSHGEKPFYLKENWDEFALLRFKRVLDEHKNSIADAEPLSSHSLVGILSCVRQAMQEALSYGILSCTEIHRTSIGQAERETTAHSDYSENELKQIREAIASEMRFVHSILSGYKPQSPDKGRDPRITGTKRSADGYGWKVEENLRWYFEHEMGAIPVPTPPQNSHSPHRAFFFNASVTHGGLHEVYRRWGLSAFVTRDLLMPVVMNLVYLTGMNPSSVLNLRVDAYQEEHPLTGMPFIAFEKPRSNGELELHLPLLDGKGEQFLKRKQALLVRKTFHILRDLTEKLRSAPSITPDLKEHLMLYQSGHRGNQGDVIKLSSAQTSGWCREMVERYDLRNDEGDPLELNLVRFRSTKLTKMALEGRDFFEIQQVARHASIKTTIGYINRNRLDVQARKTVMDALQTIRENRESANESCHTQPTTTEQPIRVYKGILSDCRNAYDPPDRVKKSKEYVAGAPCTRYNMCLFCKHVIVMREHLPVLAAYRAQIMAAQSNNIQNLPHADLYDRTLELLNELFNPERSEFSDEDIDWAIEMASDIDVVIDPLLYLGVAE